MSRASDGRVVRAPGKLFLAGEYAVLDGGLAVVAAVDRGVICRVSPGDTLHTPSGDTRFVSAALTAVEAPTRCYRFENWNPTQLSSKPGFGGSAAAVAAACLAGLAARTDGPETSDREQLERTAVAVHQQVQGSGSGLDVIASIRGGLGRYGQNRDSRLAPIPLLAVWSGSSASTGPRVLKYQRWATAERQAFGADSDAIAAAWEDDPVAALDAARTCLEAAMSLAGVAYRTAGLDRIVALAREHGGAAKPSGAGGGDVAVAVIPDLDARQAFALACAAEGLAPIPVRIVPGVSLD